MNSNNRSISGFSLTSPLCVRICENERTSCQKDRFQLMTRVCENPDVEREDKEEDEAT